MVFASIPSPSSSALELGPLTLRAYGIMIALGVLAAVWLTQRRWQQRGRDPEEIVTIAMWAVPAGIVGARAYHVATDNVRFRDDLLSAFYVWEGGLGIWGAVAGGALGAWWAVRTRTDAPVGLLAWAIAPALPLAQAIGRLGNWFNQELFGRPTDLPWALEIDPEHRPAEFLDEPTFHPTFLYEMIWNLLLVAFLIVVGERLIRGRRPAALFGLYIAGYSLGRLFIELIRIDDATEVLGQRINVWTSIIVIVGGLVLFWWCGRSDGTDALDEATTSHDSDEGDQVEPQP